MVIFRITQGLYASDLSGTGAKLFGGRWNSEGLFAVYASANRSLALLENLVHTPYKFLRNNKFQLLEIFVPDDAKIVTVSLNELPKDWNDWSPQPLTRVFGDAFLKENKALILKVPSVILPEEHNFIINPLHVKMKDVTISSQRLLNFNDRLLQAMS